MRDLDYMQQYAADFGQDDDLDPFYLKSSKEIDRINMEQAGLIPDHVLPAGPLPIARDRNRPRLPGVSRTAAIKAERSRHLLSRFATASAGGLSLVVPVLVMTNIPGIVASLVTTCIAMLIFAIGVTFCTDLKADQVLGRMRRCLWCLWGRVLWLSLPEVQSQIYVRHRESQRRTQF